MNEEVRPLNQTVLNDPMMLSLLGDEAATLLGLTPEQLQQHIQRQQQNAAASGGLGLLGAVGDSSLDMLGAEYHAQQQQQQHADDALDEISLRHRVSDLEAENARLRNLLEQNAAGSSELTRKLNLRDVVVDGLRKSVIQSQSQNASKLGHPAALGFEVVEALEEELAQAVAAQVRIREASEHLLKNKLERQDRHLRRIIAAKEREIIQLHLQFRQTLVQLRSQHTGDIQNVFEENMRLRRMAAEAEQAALLAAEMQFNLRLRAEQMRIEAECEQKVQAKLVEMKYLRECLDTQESAAKQLEDTILGLNKEIESKTRVLHHVIDVELPHEVAKVRAELQGYLDRESSRGQLDIAKAHLELEELRSSTVEAKRAALEAIRERDAAQQSLQYARSEIASKDAQLKENHSRITVLNHTVAALEREAEQKNLVEMKLMRTAQMLENNSHHHDLGASMTIGGTALPGSPTTGSGSEAEARRQLSLTRDDNRHLMDENKTLQEQLQKTKDDLKSVSTSRATAQARVADLERLLQDQILDAKAALEKKDRQLEKISKAGAEAGASFGAGAGGVSGVFGPAATAAAGRRDALRVNILVPPETGGLAKSPSFGSFRRGGGGGGNATSGSGRGTGTSSSGANAGSSGTGGGGSSSGGGAKPAAGGGSSTPSETSGSRPSSRIGDINNNSLEDATAGGSGTTFKIPTTLPEATGGDQTPEPGRSDSAAGHCTVSNGASRTASGTGGGASGTSSVWGPSPADVNNNNNTNGAPLPSANTAGGGAEPSSIFSPSAFYPSLQQKGSVVTRNVGVQCMRLVGAQDQNRQPSTPFISNSLSANALLAGAGGVSSTGHLTTGGGGAGRPTSAAGEMAAAGASTTSTANSAAVVDAASRGGGSASSFHMTGTPLLSGGTAAATGGTAGNLTPLGDGRPPTGFGFVHPLPQQILQQPSGSSGGAATATGGGGVGDSASGTGGRHSAGGDEESHTKGGAAAGKSTSSTSSFLLKPSPTPGGGEDNNDNLPSITSDTDDLHTVDHPTGNNAGASSLQQQQHQPTTAADGGNPRPLDDVDILPDEELVGNFYGVPSSLEERGINARLRIELVQIRFEVQHMCPPRFAAQALAIINNIKLLGCTSNEALGWSPVEELEIPVGATEVPAQNEILEAELERRRAFHVLLFPANHRLARFPYRVDSAFAATPGGDGAGGLTSGRSSASPQRHHLHHNTSSLGAAGGDFISLEEYSNRNKQIRCSGGAPDGVARRQAGATAASNGGRIDTGMHPEAYRAECGDLDAMRREFIASAIALSHVPGGLDVLRIPISALLRPAGNRAVEHADGSLELPHPRMLGSGFRVDSYYPGGHHQRPQSGTPRSNTSVRPGWRAPEGYLGISAAKVPAVGQFATKSNVLAPRPPNDKSLHWNSAAAAHAGAICAPPPMNQQQAASSLQQPVHHHHHLLQQVNIEVAAVLADQTFANEQAEQQRAVRERQKRDFSQVMKDRLDPGYQSGVEVAQARPASARIKKTIV